MGTFYTSCRVENRRDANRILEISQILVDTGSEHIWIDDKVLESIGVGREKKDLMFVMANGERITRSVGYAILHVAGTETIDEVVFGVPGDLQLLGARTLEGLNLRVDTYEKKLVAARPMLAA